MDTVSVALIVRGRDVYATSLLWLRRVARHDEAVCSPQGRNNGAHRRGEWFDVAESVVIAAWTSLKNQALEETTDDQFT